MVDRSRGSPALLNFFTREFGGTLVSELRSAYNEVVCVRRQTCLVHLLRELEHTERHKSPGAGWSEFAQKLRRLWGDAIRSWRKQYQLPHETHLSRRARLTARLEELIKAAWNNAHARRLVNRLRRHQDDLFTFLNQPGVPFDNNLAERAIRAAVILGRNTYGNRSSQRANVHSILVSIFFTP